MGFIRVHSKTMAVRSKERNLRAMYLCGKKAVFVI